MTPICREMAEALGFLQTTLDNVLAQCDDGGLPGPANARHPRHDRRPQAELDTARRCLYQRVARRAVVDSAALIARLARNDIIAGLDVFDPEPIPPDSPILKLPNVFLSPT
ncbi:MAG: NAD(P)-dependent oxidoreductase [Caldilineaceae bacterium]